MKHEILSISLSAVLAGATLSVSAGTGDGDAEPVSAVLRDIVREMDAAGDDAPLPTDAERRVRDRLAQLGADVSAGTAAERTELAEALADLEELKEAEAALGAVAHDGSTGSRQAEWLETERPNHGGRIDSDRPRIDLDPAKLAFLAEKAAKEAVDASERAEAEAAEKEKRSAREDGAPPAGTPVRGGTGGSAPSDATSPAVGIGDAIDEVAFTNLVWKFGGVDASGAVPDGPEIQMLRCSAEEMSFDWVRDLSCWGLARDDAAALACLFVQTADDEWIGGKFEWISSSRNRRSFENVFEGYNGWNLAGVPRSAMVAFVVVSRNGSRRSNVITALWER